MEILQKNHLPKINRPVEWRNLFKSANEFFCKVLPFGKIIFWCGLTAVCLLIFQVLIIGVFDRLGVSPKVCLIVSSLIYTAVFAGLAIVGGWKNKVTREVVITHLGSQPICKILIIKKKKQEVKI